MQCNNGGEISVIIKTHLQDALVTQPHCTEFEYCFQPW